MVEKDCGRRRFLFALGFVLACGVGGAAAQDTAITIAIRTQGAPVQVSLDCAVAQAGIERHEQRLGVAPMEVIFTASAVDCTVQAAGPIAVESSTSDGSSISRMQTSGGQLRFSLSH